MPKIRYQKWLKFWGLRNNTKLRLRRHLKIHFGKGRVCCRHFWELNASKARLSHLKLSYHIRSLSHVLFGTRCPKNLIIGRPKIDWKMTTDQNLIYPNFHQGVTRISLNSNKKGMKNDKNMFEILRNEWPKLAAVPSNQ